MEYDLRNASFKEFLDFLFDHPVAAEHWEEYLANPTNPLTNRAIQAFS